MERLLDFENCHADDLYDKINEIIDYINRKELNNPEVLYAIKNTKTGKITFNARGGAYQNRNDAISKCLELGQKTHKLVEYRLSEDHL